MLGPGDQFEDNDLSYQLDAAISLPPSLFQRINNHDTVGIFFAFYKISSLFPVSGEVVNTSSVRRKTSHIIAATVGPDIYLKKLDEPVIILLRLPVNESSVSRFYLYIIE